MSNTDLIENTHVIRQGSSIVDNDYKHQLTIQIHEIEDPENAGILGTASWTITWLGTTDAPHNTPLWKFYFPSEGVKGTFTPDRGYGPRYIYTYDHFDFY